MKLLAWVAAAAVAATTASAQVEIKYANDWKWEGPAAPFLLSLGKGYYADEGLEVTMDQGAGSLDAIPRVASGTYQMGSADVNTLIKFRDQNPDLEVMAVFMIYNKPPFAIVGRESLGVSSPKDLEGRTLGAPAPDGAYAQWDAFVAANDIDAGAVSIENVGFPVREPMLARGEVDAITGFSFSSFINLKAAGVPEDDINVLLMADYGLDLYGNVIIVNPAFAEENPEAVSAFLRATIKGMDESFASPAMAIPYVLERNDVAREAVELERFQMAIDQNFLTDEVAANGIGGIDEARFAAALEQIALTYDFENPLPTPGDIFDSSFLPSKEDRMIGQ
ncbi:MAG: ABC transporter substrate-binding protein [Pseudomonadota bacterium]